MLQCIPPDLIFTSSAINDGEARAIWNQNTQSPLSPVLLTPFKVAGGCDTVQAGLSFEVSFMMQPLMRDWPTSPWVTASFTSWFSQAGPVLQCLGCKHRNELHLVFKTMELERSKEVSLLHIISWISEMPFPPLNCQTPKIMESFKISAIFTFLNIIK